MSRPPNQNFSGPEIGSNSALDRKPMSNTPPTQANSFTLNVNRKKTEKWKNMTTPSYGGDDWREYDEDDRYSLQEADSAVSAVEPLQRKPSFNAGDDGASSPASRGPPIQAAPAVVQPSKDQMPLRASSNASSNASSEPQNRRNFSPTAMPPPLLTNVASAAPSTGIRVPSSGVYDPRDNASSTGTKAVAFMRPADIYKRIAEAREQQRRASEEYSRQEERRVSEESSRQEQRQVSEPSSSQGDDFVVADAAVPNAALTNATIPNAVVPNASLTDATIPNDVMPNAAVVPTAAGPSILVPSQKALEVISTVSSSKPLPAPLPAPIFTSPFTYTGFSKDDVFRNSEPQTQSATSSRSASPGKTAVSRVRGLASQYEAMESRRGSASSVHSKKSSTDVKSAESPKTPQSQVVETKTSTTPIMPIATTPVTTANPDLATQNEPARLVDKPNDVQTLKPQAQPELEPKQKVLTHENINAALANENPQVESLDQAQVSARSETSTDVMASLAAEGAVMGAAMVSSIKGLGKGDEYSNKREVENNQRNFGDIYSSQPVHAPRIESEMSELSYATLLATPNPGPSSVDRVLTAGASTSGAPSTVALPTSGSNWLSGEMDRAVTGTDENGENSQPISTVSNNTLSTKPQLAQKFSWESTDFTNATEPKDENQVTKLLETSQSDREAPLQGAATNATLSHDVYPPMYDTEADANASQNPASSFQEVSILNSESGHANTSQTDRNNNNAFEDTDIGLNDWLMKTLARYPEHQHLTKTGLVPLSQHYTQHIPAEVLTKEKRKSAVAASAVAASTGAGAKVVGGLNRMFGKMSHRLRSSAGTSEA